jgi:energy-coupling factor transporter ATP-binding protein EcfA2
VRTQVKLILGLFGPSGSGKTRSALELAAGISSVAGGHIVVIDTENRRSLMYANDVSFRHLELGPPYSSGRFRDAIKAAQSDGASVVVVDSASFEHDGPGGVLDQHDKIVAEKGKRFEMLGWKEAKAERRDLVNTLAGLDVHVILCFRAKERVDVSKGIPDNERNKGWWPIGGKTLVYEMLSSMLLLPDKPGVPVTTPRSAEQLEVLKLRFLQEIKSPLLDGRPLCPDHGRWLAKWCAEGAKPEPLSRGADYVREVADTFGVLTELRRQYESARTPEQLRDANRYRVSFWESIKDALSDEERTEMKAVYEAAKERCNGQ